MCSKTILLVIHAAIHVQHTHTHTLSSSNVISLITAPEPPVLRTVQPGLDGLPADLMDLNPVRLEVRLPLPARPRNVPGPEPQHDADLPGRGLPRHVTQLPSNLLKQFVALALYRSVMMSHGTGLGARAINGLYLCRTWLQ